MTVGLHEIQIDMYFILRLVSARATTPVTLGPIASVDDSFRRWVSCHLGHVPDVRQVPETLKF
jgi:hypothetical protein